MRLALIAMILIARLVAAEDIPAPIAAPKPAPREDFTLSDGRHLTGTYDEATMMLSLDGGIGALKIQPEQIAARSPATAIETATAKPEASAKAMTPEKKAAALANFNFAKIQAAADALTAEADKADKDAAALLVKAKAYRDQARTAAKAFVLRAQQEDDHYSPRQVMSEKVVTKNTATNNLAILGLIAKAEQWEAESATLQKTATSKRAQAQQMRAQAPSGE